MAFIGHNSLLSLLSASNTITPYKKENIKNGAYELCLGMQVFQTDGQPSSIVNLKEDQEIYIAPGQFALLLTEEIVNMPEDKIAFISIKAGIKFKGLVNVSGFHVDPGFEGRLLFSVYNAGSYKIVLKRGERCFPIWFAELNEKQDYSGKHEKQFTIPKDPVEALSQGDVASPSALLEKIKENYNAHEQKIELLEKEQKGIEYIVKTALGLAIIILAKFALDWLVFNQGINKGVEIKQKEIVADSILNISLKEKKQLLLEIDSLQKIKSNLQIEKTKK